MISQAHPHPLPWLVSAVLCGAGGFPRVRAQDGSANASANANASGSANDSAIDSAYAYANARFQSDRLWFLIVLTILLIGLRVYCRPPAAAQRRPAPLLGEQYTDEGEIQQRDKLQDSSDELHNEWQCIVCRFANRSTSSTCVLCGTARDDRGNDFYVAMTDSSAAEKHKDQPTHKLRRLHTFQLNARQLRARKRREYVRKVDQHGRRYWRKQSSGTIQAAALTQHTQDVRIDIDMDQPTKEVVWTAGAGDQPHNAERHSFTFVSQLAATPRHPDGRLLFKDIHEIDEFVTSTGDVIDVAQLEQASALPFRAKYAWFVKQTLALMKPYEANRFKMRVDRANVFDTSMEQLLSMQQKDFHTPIRIEFAEEVAMDAGGLTREWFALVAQHVFDETRGLFLCAHVDSAYTINPNSGAVSTDHLQHFRGVGRLIGRALLEGQHMDASLALPLLKHVLGVPISLRDLEFFDQELYRSLIWIKENDGVDALALDFSVTNLKPSGEVETIDLKENGRNIAVTDANKFEYIGLRLRYILLDAFAEQLQELLTGIFEVVPQELLLVFDYQELELVLCGVPHIDVADWKANTEVSSNLPETLQRWFWEVVEAFTDEERARLLQFVTGSARVPVQGFQALTSYDGRICHFTLKAIDYPKNAFPRAHTCFNRIDLPLYESKQQLEQVLSLVINMDVTGFTIE